MNIPSPSGRGTLSYLIAASKIRRSKGPLRLQTILLQQVIQRRPADPEQLRRARNIVVGAAHRLANCLAVGDLAGSAKVDRKYVVARHNPGLEVGVTGGNALAVSHDDGALHPVFELSNIARPGVRIDRLDRVVG